MAGKSEHYLGIYIERNTIKAAVVEGSGERFWEGDRVIAQQNFPINAKNKEESRKILEKIAEDFSSEYIASVGIGAYGPFVRLGYQKNNDKVIGYGRVRDEADSPFGGIDYFSLFKKNNPHANVRIQTDANVLALGESIVSDSDPNEIIVAIIADRGLGGGFVVGRNIVGNLHPEMGLIQAEIPTTDSFILNKIGGGGISLGALVEENSIRERVKEIIPGGESKSIEEILKIRSEKLWPLMAYYVAQLCMACTVMLSPSKIVLHGFMMESSIFRRRLISSFRDLVDQRKDENKGIFYYTEGEDEDFISETSQTEGLPIELIGCLGMAMPPSLGNIVRLSRVC